VFIRGVYSWDDWMVVVTTSVEAGSQAGEAAEVARGLSEEQRSVMRLYTPETYAFNFHRDRVEALVDLGLLEWVPPVWGDANNWGARPLGLAVASLLRSKGGGG
jgi:hypothetical protein